MAAADPSGDRDWGGHSSKKSSHWSPPSHDWLSPWYYEGYYSYYPYGYYYPSYYYPSYYYTYYYPSYYYTYYYPSSYYYPYYTYRPWSYTGFRYSFVIG